MAETRTLSYFRELDATSVPGAMQIFLMSIFLSLIRNPKAELITPRSLIAYSVYTDCGYCFTKVALTLTK